jgi:anti-sigma regulatory factor (Ser/Thr protein kinase)
MDLSFAIEGGDFTKAGYCSSEVKKALKQLNIPAETIKRIVIALYEAEVNIVAHAYRGVVTVSISTERINCVLEDSGPGIAEIVKAMQPGWSTASEAVREMGFGAGMGLPNIKKNTDRLDITSTIGKGTRVEFDVLI